MKNYYNFSICLCELQNTLDISNNKLAKALSVDPSLISKWKTGKREISTNSNYIDLMSEYISKNIIDKKQMDKILDIGAKFNVLNDINTYNDPKDFIRALLLSSLGISLEETNSSIEASFEHNETTHFGNLANYNLIIGHKNVIKTGIEFLKNIPHKPNHITTPILITFFTDSNSFSDYNETLLEWNNTLKEIQNKGWTINKVSSINNNKYRNKAIIDEMLLHLESDKYNLFHLNNYDYLFHFRELLFVPGIGALMCLCSDNLSKIESAFFFSDEQALKALEIIPKQCFDNSIPIIAHRYTDMQFCSLDEFIPNDEFNCNRFTCNSFVNYFASPWEFYKKFMISYTANLTKEEFDIIYPHFKILKDTFIEQVKIYTFNNILLKRSIENIVKNYEVFSNILSSSDVIQLLEEYVYLLETYDNFEVALLNDCNADNISNFSWTIKESNSVIIHNILSSDGNNNKVYVSLTEPTLVNAFTEYHHDILRNVAPINKDKESVILWFKAQIKSLNK